MVDDYIRNKNIKYLLLDRGFSTIIEPEMNNEEGLDVNYLYKDNGNDGNEGFYIEDLLSELVSLPNNSMHRIIGTIVYTYDNYKETNKSGNVIKEDIIDKLRPILLNQCTLDVLLSYSEIYKVAEVDLYEGTRDRVS